MKHYQRLASMLSFISFVNACSVEPIKSCSTVKSASNRVSCKVSYAKLQTDRLGLIQINDFKISAQEKIRHLNELNSMPVEFLNIMRKRVAVSLAPAGVTGAPSYAGLKGQAPRGWPAGSVWDDVPGVGGAQELVLGNSALGNNAMSLAIHEATHSVDSQTRFTSKKEFLAAYNAEKNKPNAQDANAEYRTSYPEEYLAMAVDEYYCNDSTRATLKTRYPKAYELVETQFLPLLAASGKMTIDPNFPADTVADAGSPVLTPKPVVTPVVTTTPVVTPAPIVVADNSTPYESTDTVDSGNSMPAVPSVPTQNHAGTKKDAKSSSQCN